MAQIGDIWFRLENRGYSIPGEYGDHAYTYYEVKVLRFQVEKVTKCGVRLRQVFGPGFIANHTRFVLNAAERRFACPTFAEAKESFIACKTKQAKIYEGWAKIARAMIERVKIMEIPDG